jgi:hypothetical protein
MQAMMFPKLLHTSHNPRLRSPIFEMPGYFFGI